MFETDAAPNPTSVFKRTNWDLVKQAGGDDDQAAAQALMQLCAIYWKPIHVYVRAMARKPTGEDADDLTSGFMIHVVSHNVFGKARQEQGRLRHYLLKCLKHYLIRRHIFANAIKRGGGAQMLSLEENLDDGLLHGAPELPPDHVYDHAWAVQVVRHALDELVELRRKQGEHAAICDNAQVLLELSSTPAVDRDALALAMGISSVQMTQKVFRLKQKFGAILKAHVAATMTCPTEQDIMEEVRALLKSFSA